MNIPCSSKVESLMRLPQIDLSSSIVRQRDQELRVFSLCRKPEAAWSPSDREFMDVLIANYSPNQYSSAEFTTGFYRMGLDGAQDVARGPYSDTVTDIDTLWDPEKFQSPRIPYKIGSVSDRAAYDQPGIERCLHLPIKFPGSDIRVPNEYAQFRETLKKIFLFERANNPSFEEYYAYLTVDQRFVPKGSSQRLPGAHVDGIPRDVINPRSQKIDHCYVVTNNLGTRFYTHPFPISHYDLREVNLFAAMRYFADDSRSIDTKPYDINLMNAYSVHTAYPGARHFYRTFLRLEFSVLQFDRTGNAINPYFDYAWTYRPCPLPSHLKLPDDIVLRLTREGYDVGQDR